MNWIAKSDAHKYNENKVVNNPRPWHKIKGSKADIPIVLVGNKCDEEAGPREVPSTTGETLQVILENIK